VLVKIFLSAVLREVQSKREGLSMELYFDRNFWPFLVVFKQLVQFLLIQLKKAEYRLFSQKYVFLVQFEYWLLNNLFQVFLSKKYHNQRFFQVF